MAGFWCPRACPGAQLNGKHEATLMASVCCPRNGQQASRNARHTASNNHCAETWEGEAVELVSPDTGQDRWKQLHGKCAAIGPCIRKAPATRLFFSFASVQSDPRGRRPVAYLLKNVHDISCLPLRGTIVAGVSYRRCQPAYRSHQHG